MREEDKNEEEGQEKEEMMRKVWKRTLSVNFGTERSSDDVLKYEESIDRSI